jgi:steroid delta-isomerase-like uncharacterized protein
MSNAFTSNRDVPNALFNAFDAGDTDAIDALVSPDLIDHNLPPGSTDPIEAMKGAILAMREAFTGAKHEVVYQADTDDGWVVTQWRITATHTGPWFGVPASGREIAVYGFDLAKVVDGRITEVRHVEELFQLHAQISG